LLGKKCVLYISTPLQKNAENAKNAETPAKKTGVL
jgi:hypothetical protein